MSRLLYLLWTGRREEAVQLTLGLSSRCEVSALLGRRAMRTPVFAPLVEDPRIQALLAETERFLVRARWR